MQADRQKDRYTNMQIDKQKQRHTNIQYTDKQTERQTVQVQEGSQTNGQICRKTNVRAVIPTVLDKHRRQT
jgi:hypothetical protein